MGLSPSLLVEYEMSQFSYFVLFKVDPFSEIDPSWSEVGSANRSAIQTLPFS